MRIDILSLLAIAALILANVSEPLLYSSPLLSTGWILSFIAYSTAIWGFPLLLLIWGLNIPNLYTYFNLSRLQVAAAAVFFFLLAFTLSFFALFYSPALILAYLLVGVFLQKEFTRSGRRIFYILGLAGFIVTVGGTLIISVLSGGTSGLFLSPFMPNVIFMVIAVFLLGKYQLNNIGEYFPIGIIMWISHYFFRYLLTLRPNDWPANLRPVFLIPTLSALIFAGTLLVGALCLLISSPRVVSFLWEKTDSFDNKRLKQYIHGGMVLSTVLFIAFAKNPVLIAAMGGMAPDGFLILLFSGASFAAGFITALPILMLGKKYKYVEGGFTALLLTVALTAFIIPFQASILDGGQLISLADTFMPLVRNMAVFLLIFVFAAKFRATIRYVAVPLLLLAIGITAFEWFQTRSAEEAFYTEREEIIAEAASLGAGRNVVVIVTDMLQGTIADYFFDTYPHKLESFDGFTLFTRAFTSFPFTRFSREMIQSGITYYPNSYSGGDNSLWSVQDSFLTDMQQRGAAVRGFNISLLDEFPAATGFSEVEPLRLYGYAIAASFARLTGYWTANPFGGAAQELVMEDSIASTVAHYYLRTGLNANAAEDRLIYFWDYSLHTPVVFNRDGSLRGEPADPYDKVALMDETYFGIGQLGLLFESMKEQGVYDNSLIIVVSDHGHGFGARNSEYIGDIAELADNFGNFLGIFRYNTALFVKPPFASGAAEISHQPAWSGDVRALINFYMDDFRAVPATEAVSYIRGQNPYVEVLFGEEHLSMPDMWNSRTHHQFVTVQNLYDIPGAFARMSE